MDNTHRPLSPGESEEFWANGTDARSAATGEAEPGTNITSDSEGIDVPGVGVCSADGSPVELRSGRESAVDEASVRDGLVGGALLCDAPQESPSELRERLMAKLLIASRDLAMKQIVKMLRNGPPTCLECFAHEVDGVIAHEPDCATANVLTVLRDLMATLKEDAADGEKPEAGDGIRPLGIQTDDWAAELICVRCGVHGGQRWMLLAQTSHPLRAELKNNQCEVRKCGWSYRYEHSCEGGAR